MWVLLDWLLFSVHTVLVFFNMFGWIWKRTRVAHLITLSLTAFSWIGLGAIYGWGYCLCTDYHARVLEQLGNPAADLTFIQLMFQRLLGISVGAELADGVGVAVFALIVCATAFVWWRPKCADRRGRVAAVDTKSE